LHTQAQPTGEQLIPLDPKWVFKVHGTVNLVENPRS
jgi:hypothetical protein